jgi:hypothetical protein
MRSVSEGSIKLRYIGSGTDDEREKRNREYCDDYPAVESIRRHLRVSHFFEVVDNPQDEQWAPLRELLLGKPELQVLNTKYPGRRRAELLKQWTFAELLRTISPFDGNKGMTALTHGYGLGSTLIHQDWVGISIAYDRRQRNDERRLSLEAAHAARLLSDLLVMAQLRTATVLTLLKVDKEDFRHRMSMDEKISTGTTEIIKFWWSIESKYSPVIKKTTETQSP